MAQKRTYLTATSLGLMTAAAIVTSLRGLPVMAKEELTMFVYIGFATVLFLVPAALVAAELGSAFGGRQGGVYAWVGEAFGQRWGFVAIWLQWIQNVVWYPTGLGFAAAALAFVLGRTQLADNHMYVGLFCIVAYLLATLVALTGTGIVSKVTNYGFVLGTVVPGVILIGLFVYWLASGHGPGWSTATNSAVAWFSGGQAHPRFLPNFEGLGTLSFLAGILLLFAGVEVQAVHAGELKRPQTQYPMAMLIAGLLSFGIFTIGSLVVAGILQYDKISLQSGVFDAFSAVMKDLWGAPWLVSIMAALIGYGALGGVMAWITGPSRGLLNTAQDGVLPPFMQRTNSRGVQRNILLIQACIVTVISAIYFVVPDVSAAFFLISAMTISLYIVMYLLLYAAAIRLRYTRPDLPRAFRLPGGTLGMWVVAGLGFLAVAFALVLSFVPPKQLPVGSPALYTGLVAVGLIVFVGLPLLIYGARRPSWKPSAAEEAGAPEKEPEAAARIQPV